MRLLTVAAMSLLVMASAAQAQSDNGAQPSPRDPYVTSTGETVPNPGKSQSGGTTPLDRGIQRDDNKIDNSICKGC